MWSLRSARDTGQLLNLGNGSPKRFFNYTRDPAFQQFDAHLTDLLDRHDGYARRRLLNPQHLIEIFIRSSKTERTTEVDCSFPVEIASGHECHFIRMCSSESRERGGMARPRMFTTASEGNADHCASTAISRID